MPACDRLDYACQSAGFNNPFDWLLGGFNWINELTLGSVKEVVQTTLKGPLKWLAEEVLSTIDEVLLNLTTFWVKVPTPTGNDWNNSTGVITGYTDWIVLILAFVSVLVAGIQIIRSSSGQHLAALIQSLLTLIIFSAAGVYLARLFIQISDGTATWIIDETVATTGGNFFLAISGFSTLGGGISALAVLLFGFFQIIFSVIQLVLILMRTAMLTILAGILPLAFAVTNTETGKAWAGRSLSWFAAFALYKPVAALIYATGYTITASTMTTETMRAGIIQLSLGLMIMIAATLALPALMRLLAPVIGSMAGASGAAIIAGGAGAAIGATQIASNLGGGGSSSGGASGAATTSLNGSTSGAAETAGTSATGAGASSAAGAAGTAAAGAATGGVGAAATVGVQKAGEAVQGIEGAVENATVDAAGASSAAPTSSGPTGAAPTATGAGGTGEINTSPPPPPQGAPSASSPPTGATPPHAETPSHAKETSGPTGSDQVRQ